MQHLVFDSHTNIAAAVVVTLLQPRRIDRYEDECQTPVSMELDLLPGVPRPVINAIHVAYEEGGKWINK